MAAVLVNKLQWICANPGSLGNRSQGAFTSAYGAMVLPNVAWSEPIPLLQDVLCLWFHIYHLYPRLTYDDDFYSQTHIQV